MLGARGGDELDWRRLQQDLNEAKRAREAAILAKLEQGGVGALI